MTGYLQGIVLDYIILTLLSDSLISFSATFRVLDYIILTLLSDCFLSYVNKSLSPRLYYSYTTLRLNAPEIDTTDSPRLYYSYTTLRRV